MATGSTKEKKRLRGAIAALICACVVIVGAGSAFANDDVRAAVGGLLGSPAAAQSEGGDLAVAALPQATTEIVADVPTQDIWADYLNNTKTEYAGNVWTDKSVTADESTTLSGDADNTITVYRNDQYDPDPGADPVPGDVKGSQDATFLTDLSALASSVYAQAKSDVPLDIVMVVNVSSSESQYLVGSQSVRTRLEVLTGYMDDLIQLVAERNAEISEPDKRHRVAVVKFAGGYRGDDGQAASGEPGYRAGDERYGQSSDLNYTQVVSGLTALDSASAASMKQAVSGLRANSDAEAESDDDKASVGRGMELARGVLSGQVGLSEQGESDARADAQKVVVLLSDDSTGSVAQAAQAVNVANALKADGCIVYSVGVFTGASDEDLSDHAANVLLNAVSSNYPDATAAAADGQAENVADVISLGDAADGSYYLSSVNGDTTTDGRTTFEDATKALLDEMVELSERLPVTQTGGGAAVTFRDELGAYMEVKDIKGLVYGPGIRAADDAEIQRAAAANLYKPTGKLLETQENGDTVTTYLFQHEVLPVYTVDAEGFDEKRVVPVNLGGTEEDEIRVTVTKRADPALGDIVEVRMPPRLLPLVEYEIRYDTADAAEDPSGLPHLYRSNARPAHLFYSSGLKDAAIDLIDDAGEQMVLPAAQQDADFKNLVDYARTHGYADGDEIHFYNDYYDGSSSVDDAMRGSTVVRFGISTLNRYYYFTSDMSLYVLDDSATGDGVAEGTIYGEGDDRHAFVRASLANANVDGQVASATSAGVQNVDAGKLYYLPVFYTADDLGGAAVLNDAFVRGTMENFSRTNAAQAISVADVRADSDGYLYLPEGTRESHHRGHLDTLKSAVEDERADDVQPDGGYTATAKAVLEGAVEGDTGVEYLGNNGRVSVQAHAVAEVSNTVVAADGSGLLPDHEKEFTYTLKSLAPPADADAENQSVEPHVYIAVYDGDLLASDGSRPLEVNGTFTLHHGQRALIGGLPSGWTFEVEQAAEEGYEVTGVDAEGTDARLGSGQTALAMAGVATAGETASLSFRNELHTVPRLVVPTTADQLGDEGLIAVAKEMAAGKALADVEAPFSFALYGESDFDVEAGAVVRGAEPLAIGRNGADGRVVWSVSELDEPGEGGVGALDSPLVLTGPTSDEGVRFYIVEQPTPGEPGHAGIEFSTAVYEAEVVALDPDMNGRLEVSVQYSKVAGTGSADEPADAAVFRNKYVAVTHAERNADGSYAEGALHVDVSEKLQGRDLAGRGRLRFIIVDEHEDLLNTQGDYVIGEDGEHVHYVTGSTDFSVLYDNALPFDRDVAEGETAVLSFYGDAELRSDALPEYWQEGAPDGEGHRTWTARLHVIQLQRFIDSDGAVRYLSEAGVTSTQAYERDVVAVLTDDGAGTLDFAADYGEGLDAAEFSNRYVPAAVSFGDDHAFSARVLGRELLGDGSGKTESFQFSIEATGDWAPVSPMPGGASSNSDWFGFDDQLAYSFSVPSGSSQGGQAAWPGEYDGSSRISFTIPVSSFTQENMIDYELEGGVPARGDDGALKPVLADDGSPRHVTERTFTYAVRQVGADGPGSFGGEAAGLSYDGSTVADVSVTIADDGAGHLYVADSSIQVGAAVGGDATTFTNVYASSAYADMPDVQTTLFGRDLAADQFSYTVVPVASASTEGAAGATDVEAAVKLGMVSADASEAEKLRAAARGVVVTSGPAEACETWDDDAGRYKAVATESPFDALMFYNTDLATGELDESGMPLYADAKVYSYRVTANRMPGSAEGYTYDPVSTALVTFAVTDDHNGSLHVVTTVAKGARVQVGADAAVSFQNAYDASTLPDGNPAFDGGARIDCFTKSVEGTSLSAGEATFTTAMVDKSNARVHDNLPTAGRNVRAMADGGTSPIAFFELDSAGRPTGDVYGIQFTLAQLEALRHDGEGRGVVGKQVVDGTPVYSVRYQVVEDVSSTAVPKRRVLYYIARFADNGDGTLTGSTAPLSASVFENSLGDEQELSLVGIVWVDGRPMDASDSFDFRIEPVDGAPMRLDGGSAVASKTATSAYVPADGHGRIDFGSLRFEKSDLGNQVADGASAVFTYRITQAGDTPGAGLRDNASCSGFEFDDHEEYVHVLVRWNDAVQGLYVTRVTDEYAAAFASGRASSDMPGEDDQANGDFVFQNTYRISQGVTSTLGSDGAIAVRKEMTGRDLHDDGFSVVLADRNGDAQWTLGETRAFVREDATTPDSHDGYFAPSVSFPAKPDALQNSYDHEYVFDLYETLAGDRAGRIYDKSRYRLTAAVTDDKLGHLSVSWSAVRTHDADGGLLSTPVPVDSITFENGYNATGRAAATTSKRMVGRQLFGDGFTFSAYLAAYIDPSESAGRLPNTVGEPVAVSTNGADGSVELGNWFYSVRDLGSIEAAGYLGALDASGFDRGNYNDLTDMVRQGTARKGTDGGRDCWDVLYVLKESYGAEAVPNVRPGNYGFALNVHLVDAGEGSLESTVTSYPLAANGTIASSSPTASRQFVNVYEPEPLNPSMTDDAAGEGSSGVAVWVTTEGRDQAPEEYAFELTDSSGARTVVARGTNKPTAVPGNDRVDMSAFLDEALAFTGPTDADGITFYLRESPVGADGGKLSERGISYDPTVYPVRAVVSDRLNEDGKPNGALSVRWFVYVDGRWTDEVTFRNVYEPADYSLSPTSSASERPLSVSVSLDGRAIRGSEFEFALYRAEDYNFGQPGANQPVSTGRNRAIASQGSSDTANYRGVVLGALTSPITAQGTFDYKLVQVAGTAGGVRYDTAVYDVRATAVDDGTGALSVSWAIVDADGDLSGAEAAFENEYAVTRAAEGDAVAFTDVLEGRPWKTGDQFSFTLAATGENASSAPLPTGGTHAVANESARTVTYRADAPAGGSEALGTAARLSTGTFPVTPAMLGDSGRQTFTYELTADAVGRDGLTADAHAAVITLTAYDDGRGGVATSLDVAGATRFVHEYRAASQSYTLLRATKTLNGKDLDARANASHRFGIGVTPADYRAAGKIGEHSTDELVIGLSTEYAAAGLPATVRLAPFTGVTFAQEDVADLPWDDPQSAAPTRSRSYSYSIREVVPANKPAGYVYSDAVYTVVVRLVDDGNGSLSTTTTITDADGAVVSASECTPRSQALGTVAFTNAYHAAGQLVVPAELRLVGRHMAEDEFAFRLVPTTTRSLSSEQEEALRASLSDPSYLDGRTARNAAERRTAGEGFETGFFADVDFGAIAVDTDDLNKLVDAGYGQRESANGATTYAMTFTAEEVASQALEPGTGVTKESGSFRIVARATDSGAGELSFELRYQSTGAPFDALAFENAYVPAAATVNRDDPRFGEVLSLTKLLSGRTYDNSVGAFSFTLAPSSRPSYSDDGHTPLPVQSASANASYSGELSSTTGAFASDVESRSAVAPILSFGTFKFAKADMVSARELENGHLRKTFEYELREDMPSGSGVSESGTAKNGISYDDNPQYLQISVEDDLSGALKVVDVVLTRPNGNTFENRYEAALANSDAGAGAMSIRATLHGRVMEARQLEFSVSAAEDDEASIGLLRRSGAPMGEDGRSIALRNSAAHDDGDPATIGLLSDVIFDQGDVGTTFTLFVEQVAGQDSAFSYDDRRYKLEITPTDPANSGDLSLATVLSAWKDGAWVEQRVAQDGTLTDMPFSHDQAGWAPTWVGSADDPQRPFIPFENRYTAAGTAGVQVVKQLVNASGADVPSADLLAEGDFSFTLRAGAGGVEIGSATCGMPASPFSDVLVSGYPVASERYVVFSGAACSPVVPTSGQAEHAQVRFVVDTTTDDLIVGATEDESTHALSGGAINLASSAVDRDGNPIVERTVHYEGGADSAYSTYLVRLYGYEDAASVAAKPVTDGMRNDHSKAVVYIEVEASDRESNGTLTCTTSYPSGSRPARFRNYYEPISQITVGFQGLTLLDSARAQGLENGELSFELTSETPGAPLPAAAEGGALVVGNAGQYVDFGNITFKASDVAGEGVAEAGGVRYKDFAYTVKHANRLDGDDSRWSYLADNQEIIYRVTVDEQGTVTRKRYRVATGEGAQELALSDGSATKSVVELGDDVLALFTMPVKYEIEPVLSSPTDPAAAGGLTLEVRKSLVGRPLSAGGFQFVMRGTGAKYGDDFWYGVNGMGVGTLEDGAFKVSAGPDDGHDAKGNAVDGEGLLVGDGYEDPAAVVLLPDVEFDAPGRYYFELREDVGANPRNYSDEVRESIAYSGQYYDLTADVTQDGSGALSVSWSAMDPQDEGAQTRSLEFTNVYDATAKLVSFPVFSIMKGRPQVEGGFTYEVRSPAGAAWTDDEAVGDDERTVWARGHNGSGAAGSNVRVVHDAVRGTDLVDKLTTETLDGMLLDQEALAALGEDAAEYAPTRANAMIDGVAHKVWSLPLQVTQSFDPATHKGVRQFQGKDAETGFIAQDRYDVSLIALDDNLGNLSVRVVRGTVSASAAAGVIQSAGLTSLAGQNADRKLAQTILNVSSLHFINEYVPQPTEGQRISDVYDIRKQLVGRAASDGEFGFVLTPSADTLASNVQVLADDAYEPMPATLRGTASSDGAVSFDAIRFLQAGTYTFSLREAENASPGVRQGDERYRLVATVRSLDSEGNPIDLDDATTVPEGMLSVSWSAEQRRDDGSVIADVATRADVEVGTAAEDAAKAIVFRNVYEASTAQAGGSPAVVQARKTLLGMPMEARSFQFDLTMQSPDFSHAVADLATGRLAEGAPASQGAIVATGFNMAAAADEAAGIVTASRSPISLDYTLSQLETWVAAGVAVKAVDGQTNLATYTLSYVLSENAAASSLRGPNIKAVGADALRFKVRVADNGDGSLTAEVVEGSIADGSGVSPSAQPGRTLSFTGAYRPADSDATTIRFAKELSGLAYTSQTYTFELIPQDGAPLHVVGQDGSYSTPAEGKLTAEGSVGTLSFDALTFTADDMEGTAFADQRTPRTRTFRYTLHEAYYDGSTDESGKPVDLNADGGFVRDGVAYADDATVEVRVSDSDEVVSGSLVAVPDSPVVTNAYRVADVVALGVPYGGEGLEGHDDAGSTLAWVTLGRQDMKEGAFTFELYYADEGVADEDWRTPANLVSEGVNEATVIEFVEDEVDGQGDKKRVTLFPTPGRILFSDVPLTAEMRGGADEADVYFKLVQNLDNTYAGRDVQTGELVRNGVALDQTVYDVRVHVADDGRGGLDATWAVKDASAADEPGNWKPQADFSNEYNAFGSATVNVYTQMSGRLLRAGGLHYRLHMSEGLDDAYDYEFSRFFDQHSSNARISSDTGLAAVPFESLSFRLSDLQTSMALVTDDVDARPEFDDDHHVIRTTYVTHMIVSELGDYTDADGVTHPWPASVNVVEDKYQVGTVTIKGEQRPGVFYTPADGEKGSRMPTYQVDIAAVDDGNGNLEMSVVYPQHYREDATIVDGQGNQRDVKAEQALDWVEFNNAYEPEAVTLQVDGLKEVAGRDMAAYAFGRRNESYTFDIKQVVTSPDGAETKEDPENWVTDASGSPGAATASTRSIDDGARGRVQFGTLQYTAADLDGQSTSGIGGARRKLFTYEVTERPYDRNGVTNDATSSRRFTVLLHDNVTDDLLPVVDGTLGIDVVAAPGAADDYEFAFENVYESSLPEGASTSPTAPDSGVTISQRMQGDLALNAGDCAYEMVDANGAVVASGLNAADSADGASDGLAEVTMIPVGDGLAFTHESLARGDGTYASSAQFEYGLYEKALGADRVDYDETAYTLVATLRDDGRGGLSVRWSVKDSASSDVTFVNVYEPEAGTGETSLTLRATNLLSGRDLLDPQNFSFSLRYPGSGGQTSPVYSAGSVQPVPAVTGVSCYDGERTAPFALATVRYTEDYLDQLVAAGRATKVEPTADERAQARAEGRAAKTVYTVRYVAQEATGASSLPRGVSAVVDSCDITVAVEDDGYGNLDVASVVYGGAERATAADFSNAYNVARTVSLQATETMNGRDLLATDVFHAVLAYPDGSAVVALDDSGAVAAPGSQQVEGDVSGSAADGRQSDAVTFASLRFSTASLKALLDAGRARVVKQPGDDDPSITYAVEYTASQTADDPAQYVTADTADHAVTLIVNDSRDENARLRAWWEIDGREAAEVGGGDVAADAVAFENTYAEPYFAQTDESTAADVRATVTLRGKSLTAADAGSFRYQLRYADGSAIEQPRDGDPEVAEVTLPVTAAAGVPTAAFSLGTLHYTTTMLDRLVDERRALASEDDEGNVAYTIGYLACGDVSVLPESVTSLDDPCQLAVTVTVTDDGSGLLRTAVGYAPAGSAHADFAYQYDDGFNGRGTATVRATATMSGRALDARELFFGADVQMPGEGGVRVAAADVLDVTAGAVSAGDFVANPASADAGVASDPFVLAAMRFDVAGLEKLVRDGYATLSTSSEGADVYDIRMVAYQALAPYVTVPAGVSARVAEVPFDVLVVDRGEGPLEASLTFADGAATANFEDAYAAQYLDGSAVIRASSVLEGRRSINSDEGRFLVRLFYKGTDIPASGADGEPVGPVAAGIVNASGEKRAAGEPSPAFDVAQLNYTPEFLRSLADDPAVPVRMAQASAAVASGQLSTQALGSSAYEIDYEVCAVDASGGKLAVGDQVVPGVVVRDTGADVHVSVAVADGKPVSAAVTYGEGDVAGVTSRYEPVQANQAPVQAVTKVEGGSPGDGDYTVRVRYADADGKPVDDPVPAGAQLVSTPGADEGSETTDAYTVLDLAVTADGLNALVGDDIVTKGPSGAGSDEDVDEYEFTLVVSEDVLGDGLPANVCPVTSSAYARVKVRESLGAGTLSVSVAYLDADGNPVDADAALLVNRYVEASDPLAIGGVKKLFGGDSGRLAPSASLGGPASSLVAAALSDGAADGVALATGAIGAAGAGIASGTLERADARPIEEGQFEFELRYRSGADSAEAGVLAQVAGNGAAFEEGGNEAPISFVPLAYGFSTVDGVVNLLDLVAEGHARVSTEDGVDTYVIPYVVVESDPGAGMQPNGQSFGVVVTVMDDPQADKLSATAEFGDADIAFENTYLADRSAYAVEATVVPSGDHEMSAGEYEFTFTPTGDNAAQAPLPSGGSTAKNDAAGGIRFGDLVFTYDMLGGEPSATFRYVMHQVVRNASGEDANPGDGTLKVGNATYPADVAVTVTLHDTGDGRLDYRVEKSGDGSFTVRYEPEASPSDDAAQPGAPTNGPDAGGQDGQAPANGPGGGPGAGQVSSLVTTGDAVPLAALGAVAAVAALVAALGIVMQRRHRGEGEDGRRER